METSLPFRKDDVAELLLQNLLGVIEVFFGVAHAQKRWRIGKSRG